MYMARVDFLYSVLHQSSATAVSWHPKLWYMLIVQVYGMISQYTMDYHHLFLGLQGPLLPVWWDPEPSRGPQTEVCVCQLQL